MIIIQDLIEIHSLLIKKYGGSQGIRDINMLLSSVNRPFQTFDGTDLYPTYIEKAAAICESLVINHPFVDGNKRIAYYMLVYFIKSSGFEINATLIEKRNFIISIAEGKLTFEQINDWIKNHTIKLTN